MTQATITVQFVNQPRTAGGKKGSIKDSEGRYWGVWADKLSQYEQGKSYDITYETSQWQGKDQHTVKTATLRGAALPPVNHNSNGINGNGGSKDRQIFVCAVVKEWVPKIPVGETTTLISAIQAAMSAYDATFGSGDEQIPQ